MDPGFHQYLVGRKVPDKVLKALKKEAVTNEQTLKVMKDSDLESLKKKYKLPVGQLVLLREARDELIRRAQASARGDGSFEVLDLNPGQRPGDVEREYAQRDTAPLLTPSPDQQHQARREKRRLRAEEIRDKYKLPSRSDRYSRLKGGGNGASAVSSSSASPSPVPQPERLHSPARTEGLAVSVHSIMCIIYTCSNIILFHEAKMRDVYMHESNLRQLWKSDCLGCAVLLCLVVCLTLLVSFFLPLSNIITCN